jgi:ABC-type bacteriocin/lantibiotic exporter with double-glycine peptidase domain
MLRTVQRGAVLVCLWTLAAAAEPAGVWLDVPFVKQEKDGCGAASIAMVMQYWQRQRGEQPVPGSNAATIQRALYSSEARGIFASSLTSYLEGHGFRAFAFAGKWDDLQQHLQKGRPLIVALQPGSGSALHYVVVVGLDAEQSLVLVNDPAERKLLRQDRAHFEKEWKGAGNWTLLATPQEGASSAR